MVYLIGAGPGNPGLITAKGLEILKRCEVLIYDRLGTNELIELAPKECEKIFVGKRPGEHYKKQEEINEILVSHALTNKLVVRLKGGDPFVFGRGGEEILELEKNNIPYQVIPGITSAIAVPELAGIPVTHRSVSRGFHVYTGHTNATESDLSYVKYNEGTSIFLMGISNLNKIVDRLISEGAPEETPVAIISSGTLPGEKKIIGTLGNISTIANTSGIVSPAIIVVGETASYDFTSSNISPMKGMKIGAVGSPHFRERMRPYVEKKAAQLFSICSMDIEATKQAEEIDEKLEKIDQYRWIAFTSANSIKLFFERIKEIHFDFRKLAHLNFAVVGSGTAKTLREYGFIADYIPAKYTTTDLAEGLAKIVASEQKVIIPRALRGSDELLRVLDDAQVDYDILPIYDVVGQRTENWEYIYDFDVIILASGSGVEAFVDEIKKDSDVVTYERLRKERGQLIGVIGDVTRDALLQYGICADIIPKQCDSPGLVNAIEEYLINRRK